MGAVILIFLGLIGYWISLGTSQGHLRERVENLERAQETLRRELSQLRRENGLLRRHLADQGVLPEELAAVPGAPLPAAGPAEYVEPGAAALTAGYAVSQPPGTPRGGSPTIVGAKDDPVLFKLKVELAVNSKTQDFAGQLRISSERGVVSLEGTAPSEADRANAERVVRGVMGVAGVVNRLRVGEVAAPVFVPEPLPAPTAAPPAAPAPPPPAVEGVPAAERRPQLRPSRPKLIPSPRIPRPSVDWSNTWRALAGPFAGELPGGGPGEGGRRVSQAEAAIGVVWLSRAGIVLLIIGAIFAYRYGVTNDTLRVAIGYLAGLAVLGLGYWGYRRRYRVWAQAITGGGIALLYLTTTAGTSLFASPVIPHMVGMGLMVLITALATGLALLYDAIAVGVLGLIGGFATPFLLSAGGGGGDSRLLFGYVAALDAGLLLVAYFRRWSLYNYLVFAATWGIYGLWRLARFQAADWPVMMGFATLYFAIFAVVSITHNIARRKKGNPADLALATINGFVYFACGLDLLEPGLGIVRGFFAFGVAAFYVALGTLNFRLNREDRPMTLSLLGLAWVFLTVAFPVALKGPWISLAWAAEGAVLCWLGLSVPVKGVKEAGLAVLGLAVGRLVTWDTFPGLFGQPLASPLLRAVTFLGVAAALYAAARAYTVGLRSARDAGAPGRLPLFTRDLLGVGGCVLTVWYLTREVVLHYMGWDLPPLAMAVSGAWALYALAVSLADLRLRYALVRSGARALMAAGLVVFALGAGLFRPPQAVSYFGACAVLGSIWAAEWVVRRRGLDARRNGILSLAGAAVGFVFVGDRVALAIRSSLVLPIGQPSTPVYLLERSSKLGFGVSAGLAVYALAAMVVAVLLRSRSGRALACGFSLATMGFLSVLGVPNPAAPASLRVLACALVIPGGLLSAYLAGRFGATPPQAGEATRTKPELKPGRFPVKAGVLPAVVGLAAALALAWWGSVEVLFAFARAHVADLGRVLTGGVIPVGLRTGDGAYGLVVWLGFYSLALRLIAARLRSGPGRWLATASQGATLLVLLGVVIAFGGGAAWQALAFAASVLGVYVSGRAFRGQTLPAPGGGDRGPSARELRAGALLNLAACAITLVWMAFSVVRLYPPVAGEPVAVRLAALAARNHWILVIAGLYGLGVLAAGLALRRRDTRFLGLFIQVLAVAGVMSAGTVNAATSHGLRFLAYAATVGGLYASTWLTRAYPDRSEGLERGATQWASLAAAAATVIWLAVQVNRFFVPFITSGTEAEQAFARTTMDFGVSAAWGIYGLLVLFGGFALRHRWTRVLGLGVFVLTLGKIVASDMWQLAFRWRIWITVGIGVIFVAASFMYQRFIKVILLDDRGDAGSPGATPPPPRAPGPPRPARVRLWRRTKPPAVTTGQDHTPGGGGP